MTVTLIPENAHIAGDLCNVGKVFSITNLNAIHPLSLGLQILIWFFVTSNLKKIYVNSSFTMKLLHQRKIRYLMKFS